MELDPDLRSIQEVRSLLRSADEARKRFGAFDQADVDRVVASMSDAAFAAARELAEDAVKETGFGRVEDKVIKNTFAARNVWESIRSVRTVGAIREDKALGTVEIAVPMGIVAGIIPTTNPTSTTIFKALISVKGRNAIVFSPHPSAKRCIGKAADILHDAAIRAGAPPGIVGCLANPTMEATTELMRHPLTAVILATGGHALVKAAYSSGKPAYGVGPGNVPAFIERTADVPKAVEMVLAGKCFDNGTICASEQSLVADAPVAAEVRRQMARFGAHLCTPEEKKLLEKAMVVRGGLNPAVVGRPPHVIAGMAGFKVPEATTALVAELTAVGPEEPLCIEKLSPVLGLYTADGWREGCELCIKLLNYGGLGHSMSIHSRDEEIIRMFAVEKPASRILANTPSTHGAIGYSTGLAPSLTLGCGAWGGNITSDNVTALHLVHIKRLAYGIRPVEFPRGLQAGGGAERPTGAPSPAPVLPREPVSVYIPAVGPQVSSVVLPPPASSSPVSSTPSVNPAPAPATPAASGSPAAVSPASPELAGPVDRQVVRDLVESALRGLIQDQQGNAPAKDSTAAKDDPRASLY
ncbi:MAG: aldehyde dehydrogenase family protein [Acidobacteria bacterium]|nr:aldehyde dehydrogenase family protein [Acidobacteriota bacterium]